MQLLKRKKPPMLTIYDVLSYLFLRKRLTEIPKFKVTFVSVITPDLAVTAGGAVQPSLHEGSKMYIYCRVYVYTYVQNVYIAVLLDRLL